MQYVKITVDGKTYRLSKVDGGAWTVTNRAPLTDGEYLVDVSVVTESGQEIELSVDDPELLAALTLIVQHGTSETGERMLDYYPKVLQPILEFQAIVKNEGFEIDFLRSDMTFTLNDAYLTTMTEDRVSQWEVALGITPSDTDSVDDRRDVIISRVRGNGKLNTELINSIVGAFTAGGTAASYIQDSVLYVKVNPPVGNKQYKFTNVKKELEGRIPAHIGLSVSRNYATWDEVKSNFQSWTAVSEQESWDDVRLFIAPQ